MHLLGGVDLNIVFIVGSYYPYYSAVGRCVGNIADELSRDHQVTIICQRNFTEQKDFEVHNNQRIIRVDTKENKLRNNLNRKIETKQGLSKKKYQLILNAYKFSRIIKTIFSSVTIRKELVNEYTRALNKIDETIDLIIPASMPFESVVASSRYIERENNKTKMVPYLFDQFVDSDTLHRTKFNRMIKRKRNLRLEEEELSKSYKVLAMHSLKKHFSQDLPEIMNVKYLEHPLLLKFVDIKGIKSIGIKMSYIGGLYKNYVMPDYLLQLYENSNLNDSTLNFYIIGNCFDIVNRYADTLPERIINHGSVDKETANLMLVQSDILISIAENKGIQISSKIFEYMSSGKPVIHLYTVDNDVNLKVLNKYPLSLCLKQDLDILDKNVGLFDEFCRRHSNCRIPFEEVEKIYYDATPKYTADLIMDLIK